MLENNKVYTLGEFCKILKESQQAKQEFKPKKGEKVDTEDKENNGKAVEDILKQTKEYDGGIQDKPQKKEDPRDLKDYNKDMLGWRYKFPPNEKFVKDTEARVRGFASADNEKNSKIKEENKGLDFEGNENYLKSREEVEKDRHDALMARKLSGLRTSKENEINKGETEKRIQDRNKTIFNENRKMKRLHFNKTVFLNESEMLKKIPNDMKVDGNKFLMKDSAGNEYLIECARDKVLKDVIHTNVVDYRNKEKINEEFNRMKQLYSYKSSGNNQNSGKYENEMVGKMLSESKEKLFVEQK